MSEGAALGGNVFTARSESGRYQENRNVAMYPRDECGCGLILD
jgi:hypothetical protein